MDLIAPRKNKPGFASGPVAEPGLAVEEEGGAGCAESRMGEVACQGGAREGFHELQEVVVAGIDGPIGFVRNDLVDWQICYAGRQRH